MVFLPNLTKRKPVAKVARTCSKLMREDISSASYPVTAFEAISPP